MRPNLILLLLVAGLMAAGCETVHETGKAAGTYIGKGVNAAGGVTEGAVEGYVGSPSEEENPMNR